VNPIVVVGLLLLLFLFLLDDLTTGHRYGRGELTRRGRHLSLRCQLEQKHLGAAATWFSFHCAVWLWWEVDWNAARIFGRAIRSRWR
jgi:hypothetical protein